MQVCKLLVKLLKNKIKLFKRMIYDLLFQHKSQSSIETIVF